jgi:hypothetical protein
MKVLSMKKRVRITTEPASPEDVARILGVSAKRAAELSRLAEEVATRTNRREKRESRKRGPARD